MSPAVPSEKPRRRTSSSPVSPARKVTPAVVRSTSRKSSRLRSCMSFSVITVTLCGMSRSAWLPLPISVRVARSCALLLVDPSPTAESRTVTVESVPATGACCAAGADAAAAGAAGCASAVLPSEPASSMAPSGSKGLEGVCAAIESIAACACAAGAQGWFGLKTWSTDMAGPSKVWRRTSAGYLGAACRGLDPSRRCSLACDESR